MNRYAWPIAVVVAAVILAAGAVGTALALHHSTSGPAPGASKTPTATVTVTPVPAGSATATASTTPSPSPSASSPAAALADVTVCTQPVVSCGGAMRTEPAQIVTSGDGSGYVRALVWSGWGAATAQGTGTLEVDNCTPNCAQGTYTGYPATVTLTSLTPYDGGARQAYATMTVAAPSYTRKPYHYLHLLP